MKKILVVEDDPVQQQQICDILKQLNAEVSVVGDGGLAVEKAKSDQPDLILMDIIMPHMDGYAACRTLTSSADTKHIPVLIVSSKNQEADRVWAQLQGARGLVGKPFSEETLMKEVNALL